jgi:AcrR family transcriptional regulator
MDKSDGQAGRTAVSAPTREKLMAAAAELIAEVGWGRVTTRAVAERAGLPHGAVSYHFRGKQELLTEAAMYAFAQAVPADEFAALAGVEDLIGLIAAEIGGQGATSPALTRLMFEAMREAERDPGLRERMGAMLARYRELMVQAVRAEQERGAVFTGAPADAIATLLGAVGDGLLLHALLDPGLDVQPALDALRALLAPRPS